MRICESEKELRNEKSDEMKKKKKRKKDQMDLPFSKDLVLKKE